MVGRFVVSELQARGVTYTNLEDGQIDCSIIPFGQVVRLWTPTTSCNGR